MPTTRTYYDPRAARMAAAADAERARAEAEATRAETALRMEAARLEMAARQAEQAEQARAARERSRAARREERRRQRAAARAARRAAVRRGIGALATAVVTRAPLAVGGVAMGAPIAIAWRGQLEFAAQVMHLGTLAPALPIALEGAAWYLAYLTHRSIKAGLPAGRYRAWTWGLAGIAAAMNLWHGAEAYGLQAGVVLALASLLGIALWELTASLAQRTRSGRTAAEIRQAAWRRIRYPRLSWAAASIRAARGESCTPEEAWRAAWMDRYGVGPESSRRERRLARQIVRHSARAEAEAARAGQLAIVDGAIVRTDRTGAEAVRSAIGPARTDDGRTDTESRTARTEESEPARTDDGRTETLPVRWADLAPRTTVDRAALIRELTADILAAAERGEKWVPDYPALEARTGRRRSWCEKVVREARSALVRTDGGEGTVRPAEPRTDDARTEVAA